VELLARGERYPAAAILTVDDDAGNLLALEAVLAPLGHTIVAARSGEEAIARAKEREFALALVDVTMRGMDGFETVSRLRRIESFRVTPVVFVTGYADSVSAIQKGYEAGAIDYVTKPIDPDLLRLKAASFVLLYQRGEELKRKALEVAVAESARKAAEEYSAENARLYKAAERAAAAREELLAVVSHDLQNPLQALMMKASLLQRQIAAQSKDSPISRVIDGIVRAGRQMSELLRLLVDATAVEKGSLSIELKACDPAELAREVIELYAPIAAAKPLRLAVELGAGLPSVHADRSRVFQVLSNLVGNAIKYTGGGGQVTLRVAGSGDRVSFSVLDTGKGIAPEHLPRLFERYWQVDRKREGLGLGLYISKGIVEAHGGNITVVSAPGEGSTFTFTLALARDGALAGAASAQAQSSVPG
jgi:two-component system, sensor histidine kinase and response regulator